MSSRPPSIGRDLAREKEENKPTGAVNRAGNGIKPKILICASVIWQKVRCLHAESKSGSEARKLWILDAFNSVEEATKERISLASLQAS